MKNPFINRVQNWLQPKPRYEHLLIVEDEEELSTLFTRFFERQGYRVTVAASLAEAETKLADSPFDLVLQDVMLPDGDGLEFVPRIKELRPGVPVIILTGLGYDEDMLKEAVKGGVASYLSKFLPLDQVLMEIKGVLKALNKDRPESCGAGPGEALDA